MCTDKVKVKKPIIYAQYTQAQEKYQYCECKNIPKTHINTLNTHIHTHTGKDKIVREETNKSVNKEVWKYIQGVTTKLSFPHNIQYFAFLLTDQLMCRQKVYSQ